LRDDRIQAVIALNPVTSSLFGPEGFAKVSIPSLLVAGSSDPLAPALLEQIRPFTWLNAADAEINAETNAETSAETEVPHYLALIQGGSHLYDPLEIEGTDRVAAANQLVTADTDLGYSYLKALSLGFMQAEVDQNPVYQEALDSAAVIQIGQQPLPLYIVTTLTEAMLTPPEPSLPMETEPPSAPESVPSPSIVPPNVSQ
ncbi:MAG: hypothetical protein AAFN12_17030, partial [Cyanobacteria bacterium J06560_2]